MLTLPEVGRRKKQPYLAIRSSLTMRQIKKQGPIFLSEVRAYMDQRGIEAEGPAFFRYNAIDPAGQLEMEFGFFTARAAAGMGPIRSGILPSGRHASLTYHGPYDRLAAVTAMLNGWAQAGHVAWDAETGDKGTVYASWLEIYHNDPASEPDPAKWITEIAIKVADRNAD